MSNINRGKQFEDQVRVGLGAVPNTVVTRLIDPQNGFAGVRNVCDFIAYHYPHSYYIECKSTYGNTLPFSNITVNQWQGLLKVSLVAGIVAGVLVWFIDHDKTLFVPIQTLERRRIYGDKSLNITKLDVLDNEYEVIPGTKRRILFDYDFARFLSPTR